MRPTDELPVIFADQVRSLNYDGPDVGETFADAGTLFDLSTGTITSTGLVVDGVTGDLSVRGDITAEQLTILSTNSGEYRMGELKDGLEFHAPQWTDPASAVGLTFAGSNTIVPDVDEATATLVVTAETVTAQLGLYSQSGAFGNQVRISVDDGSEDTGVVLDTLGGSASTVISAGTKSLGVHSDGEVKDHSTRQFTRADSNRGNPILIQAGSDTTTASSAGLVTITFQEEFSSTPEVVVSRNGTSSSSPLTANVHSVSTTGFLFRCWAGATRQDNASVGYTWIAYGPKSGL